MTADVARLVGVIVLVTCGLVLGLWLEGSSFGGSLATATFMLAFTVFCICADGSDRLRPIMHASVMLVVMFPLLWLIVMAANATVP
jgi:hypothetical protein